MTAATNLMIPVQPCMPWCVEGERKHATEHPEDRYCWSPHVELPRSLSTPQHVEEDVWEYDYVGVFARRLVSGQRTVVLYLPEEDADPQFTPSEARAIAKQLLAHADLVDPDGAES